MKYAIVLAAGLGTRMKQNKAKCAITILGRPMIEYLLETLSKLNLDEIYVVVGHKKEDIIPLTKDKGKIIIQEKQLGTASAVLAVLNYIKGEGETIIVSGDTPLISKEMFESLLQVHKEKKNSMTILSTIADNPYGYGRVIYENDKLKSIVEEQELTKEEKKVNEINLGVYVVDNKALIEGIPKINNNNKKQEFYLTDLVAILAKNYSISSYLVEENYKAKGINDLTSLAIIEEELGNEYKKNLLENGVRLINQASITISPTVKIEKGSTILPGSILLGKTIIGKNCVIGPNTEINNTVIEDDVYCKFSIVADSYIGSGSQIGPFAHIRMNSQVGSNNRIGNFVEIKNSITKEKTKASHLAYLGDAEVGHDVNFGCGAITVNYDGKTKNKTIIGDAVFVGCNSNLIAPIKIGSNAFIAAGSTITDSIDDFDFAISRDKQHTKKGYASKYHSDK